VISYYQDYISLELLQALKKQWKPVPQVPGLWEVGSGGGLETKEALQFLCDLYRSVEPELAQVLKQRQLDREFFDQRTKACFELNKSLNLDYLSPDYQTVLGQEDAHGRIVVGPKNDFYAKPGGGKPIAEMPEFLKGPHVTLFGPPDDPKLSINAMNAFHRKLKGEPAIVSEVLKNSTAIPKWGADDEDSKTPLRKDLISAGENLTGCFEGNLEFTDPGNKKTYRLEKDHLSLPIKRFPGLALPSLFLFLNEEPLPLHLYDFALHFFRHWQNPKALAFYVPKLENEEEARYIRQVMETAERMIQELHPEYVLGTIRLFVVLENPRAIFRVHEIMDELHPFFAGASLGWHDYLASTARLFKEDGNYRIPVKADPNIVIKYIKASHDLLAQVVGPRGGIKIGGMYGVLPQDGDLAGPSFQITLKGFIKDVVTQMKRDLSGFWVAHPDFVRIGMALTEAWKSHSEGQTAVLETLVTSLLSNAKDQQEILSFIKGPDLVGLDRNNPLYPRYLMVADIKESHFIANNHPDEIRYNVFQSLQYLTDWLSGNGCVALPAQIEGVPVRVMDDLATAERSRWEVWHEIHHGRFSVEEFLKIAHEEYLFIRKDLSNDKKIVQVKWDARTEKWYPIALKLMIQLMTEAKPMEFASELLLPLTVESIRNSIQNSPDPWSEIQKVDPKKYTLTPYIERFHFYFSVCGSLDFAKAMAKSISLDLVSAESQIKGFSLDQVKEAAAFHGDIGENKKTLDEVASKEQALVLSDDEAVKKNLRLRGQEYLKKFGFKFLISAKGKTGTELLAALESRMANSFQQELDHARSALWEISRKRFEDQASSSLQSKIESVLIKTQVKNAQICISTDLDSCQNLNFGDGTKLTTWFELASLSKTVAACFSIEYFKSKNISLDTPVNELLGRTTSGFRLTGSHSDKVTLTHLMNHTALNLHYVNGVPATQPMPRVNEFLEGNPTYGYDKIAIVNSPGTVFQYSGGGFLVLEHLIESLEKKSIQEVTVPFLAALKLANLTFEQKTLKGQDYATGYLQDGTPVEGTRKMFPAFAAGAMGNAHNVLKFLKELGGAFQNLQEDGPISHDTAIRMLHGVDNGSVAFMKAKMGLGVFTIEAGPNRFMLHQGANDGFRALFLHCYQGPDANKGFVILCNGDINGVFFVAEAAQLILQELEISGIDSQAFQKDFDLRSIPSEQVVNLGYKELLLKAFRPDLPEEILAKGPKDSLAPYNLAVGGKILAVSNQGFARAENLLSDHLPIFDPELYGRQGKIMDSWETVRHNQAPSDTLVFELKKPAKINYVSLSTKYHLGNQAQAVQVEGLPTASDSWQVLVPKTPLEGHSIKKLRVNSSDTTFKQVKVRMFPDGGLTRLGLYDETLPALEKEQFQMLEQSQNKVFEDPIPLPKKPLTPKFQVTAESIEKLWALVPTGSEVNVASQAYGASIVRATNEHYSPATQIISPYPPLNMFDGSESSRSRDKNHFEEVVIGIEKQLPIHRLEVDFTFFRNNNPYEMSLEAKVNGTWEVLLPKTPVKAYAGQAMNLPLKTPLKIEELKVTVFPDGGINRLRLFGIKKEI
jgi:allantoicase/malate synthase